MFDVGRLLTPYPNFQGRFHQVDGEDLTEIAQTHDYEEHLLGPSSHYWALLALIACLSKFRFPIQSRYSHMEDLEIAQKQAYQTNNPLKPIIAARLRSVCVLCGPSAPQGLKKEIGVHLRHAATHIAQQSSQSCAYRRVKIAQFLVQ